MSHSRDPQLDNVQQLRKKAERQYRRRLDDFEILDTIERDQLLQELQIHQIELELQNEELREAHVQLELTHQQYINLYNEAPIGYASLDDTGIIVRCNRTLSTLLGSENELLQGRALAEFMVDEDQTLFRSRFTAFAHKPLDKTIDVRFRQDRKDNQNTRFIGRIQGRRIERSNPGHRQERCWTETLLVVISDVTELKRTEAKIQFQAYHDNLTGLHNRSYLQERLDSALAQARRHGSHGALLFMDLDRFKNVNDSLGHHAGDELLIEFTHRLRSHMRREDLLVRMGGDEFIVLISEQQQDHNACALQAKRLANHLFDTLDKPFQILDNLIQVTISIGITVFPFEKDDRCDDVIRQADTAMYQAKAEGRNQARFFHSKQEQRARQRLMLETEMRTALVKRQFEIYYQPQVSAIDGRILGVEALLRWHHPDRGLLLPHEFIRTMEESGLMVPIGRWIIEQVTQQMAAWRTTGHGDKHRQVALNICACQLNEERFADQVEMILKHRGLDPACLVFEITETLLLPQDSTCQEAMRRLEALGLTFSVDDFGTGYSSLFSLHKSQVGQLKIAQQFVTDLDTTLSGGHKHRQVLPLIRAIVLMAKELGMSVVAEGVETEAQRQLLLELGCDLMQGFLFAPPMQAEEISELFRQNCTLPLADGR
jgi:diguanylate cyclase (GGDEF)-like protein/PAS domain S-box-containing protein